MDYLAIVGLLLLIGLLFNICVLTNAESYMIEDSDKKTMSNTSISIYVFDIVLYLTVGYVCYLMVGG